MNAPLKNDLLIRACRGEAVPRRPVWIMRQAGRYLPEYRAVRRKADFLTMCRTPELAAEVTLQPVDIIGVDAAIIFSDILVIPDAMGMILEFHEGRGPVFTEPLASESDIKKLRQVDVASDLGYVLEAVTLVKRQLEGRVPVIGFAGAPWTLAAYMVEGSGSRNFGKIKGMMYKQPGLLHKLLEKLSEAVADYLAHKITAGADVVQIFDSWAGILPPKYFREFALPYLKKVVSQLKQETDAPVIVFAREAEHSVELLADIGADVLGISWREEMGEIRRRVGDKVALQGNLDPCVLYATPEKIRAEAKAILKSFGDGPGHVFNLGHGILPDTPVENARALVQAVQSESESMTAQPS